MPGESGAELLSVPLQLLVHDDILEPSTHVFCSPDDIGIPLRLWPDLRSLAFLSNTTAGSTLQPLLTTLSFTLIHHEKKQSNRHHLPLNLVVLTKAIKPTPQVREQCTYLITKYAAQILRTPSVYPRQSDSPTLPPPIRSAQPSPRDPRHKIAMMAPEPTLSSLASSKMKQQSRRDYIRELREVTDEADVVLVHDLTGRAPSGRGGNAQLRDGGKAARVRVQKNDAQATDPEVVEAEDARGP
ncbi:hypothetical protein EDB85DRAFT_2153396 [Lactarius pseudohatsudake]|nr:hypothetical protein EDB85DRAFT_2153396 [Lactarius pseudohatsudake]